MGVPARNRGAARVRPRRRVTQKVRDVILVDARRPKPCGEGVPEVVVAEVCDPGVLDGLRKDSLKLTPLPSRPRWVEQQLILTHARK